jgi:hypothetical protein
VRPSIDISGKKLSSAITLWFSKPMSKTELVWLWLKVIALWLLIVGPIVTLMATTDISLPSNTSKIPDEAQECASRIQALEFENNELNQRIRQLEASVALAQDDAAYCKEMVVHLGEIVREERSIRFYETQNIVGVGQP